jgi:hypothetical protein
LKIDHSVKEATGIIAIGVVGLSLLMELIYGIVVLIAPTLHWEYSFLLGNLLMGVTVILNFFLMALGIRRAVDSEDPAIAKKKMQLSQMLRSILIIGILIMAFLLPCFHIVSTIITVAFPQITVFLARLIRRDRFADEVPEALGTQELSDAAPDAPEAPTEAQPDRADTPDTEEVNPNHD